MLYCDQQCEGCKIWYHYDCYLSDGQWLGVSQENFVCPFCIDNSPFHASPVTSGSAPNSVLGTQFNSSHVPISCGIMFLVNKFVIF